MKHIKLFESFEGIDIERILGQFPDNATNWSQATDELPEMYMWITETSNFELKPVGRKNCKTPAEWNQKYKEAIRKGFETLSDEQKKDFWNNFKHWSK